MKKIIFVPSLLFSIMVFSQVGINTANPQQPLHVDGKKDNPASGVPTAIQQGNDFVVASDGSVGVGIVNPTQKLDVNGKARIRDTEILTGTISPLYVDVDGLIGKTSAPQAQIAFFTTNSDLPFNATNYNTGAIQTVPIQSSYATLNTVGVTVPTSGSVKIAQAGTYMLSGSVTPILSINNDGDGYVYMAVNIDISTNGGTSWSSISGGRSLFSRVVVGSARSYSFTIPTVVKVLNVGDLIRIKLYRTTAGDVVQGSSVSAVSLDNYYGAPTFTLSITKL